VLDRPTPSPATTTLEYNLLGSATSYPGMMIVKILFVDIVPAFFR
jgi:hypothetical protein